MSFRRKCPTCKANDKIIKRCNKCLNLVCSNCSIWGYCIDCYIEIREKEEVSFYHDEYNTDLKPLGIQI